MLVITILPFAGLIAAVTLLWNQAVGWTDLVLFAGLYVICGFGITIGYHRMLTHRAFEAVAPLKAALLVAGSFALQGSARRLGDRPPHPPRPLRQGGRPAQPAPRLRPRPLGRAQGPRPRPHGLAVRPQPLRPGALRQGPPPGPDDDGGLAPLPALGGADVRRPVRPRRPAHDVVEGRRHRPRVGRPRAPLLQPPHHVERELDLPLLRQAAVRGGRPLDEQLGAGAALARRVVAPQPPRVPHVGLPRARHGARSTCRAG